VQDAVEHALSQIAGEKLSVTCAGRTDRGVHARAQVVHFDTRVQRPESAWVRGVNALLPDSVAVLWSRAVPDEFHARFSAFARTYRYELLNRPVRPALASSQLGWFHLPLDVERMREAAALLVGEHDFSAFRSSECQAKSPVRRIHEFSVARSGERIDFVVRANAFLHHMVRNIAGLLLAVGRHEAPPEWAREVLEGRDRTRGAATAPAAGLYLLAVRYPAAFDLPAPEQAVFTG